MLPPPAGTLSAALCAGSASALETLPVDGVPSAAAGDAAVLNT